MFTKIKNVVIKLIELLNQLAAAARKNLGPALRIGKVITAVYSVYMVTVLIFCGFLGYSLDWLTAYPGADLVAEILLIISLATLVLSGAIAEALEILLLGLEAGLSLASIPSGSWVALAISAVLFVIPLLLAVLVILCAPIIPVLLHWYRKDHCFAE